MSDSAIEDEPKPRVGGQRRLADIPRRVLNRLREGQPRVFWPAPGLRFGNLLYLWMQAHMAQRQGQQARVLDVEAGHSWRAEFPRLFDELTVPRVNVRFLDQRVLGTFQAFDYHFHATDVENFCEAYLLHAPGIERFHESAGQRGLYSEGSVTINVRRGDYYSVPGYKQRYGFDVRGFVLEALDRQMAHAEVSRVLFVSDDVRWCVENLGPEIQEKGLSFAFCDGRDGVRDFAHLALSKRLILANSTFSYWGGFAATVRDSESHVVAPWFHARDWLGGRSFHLHPTWTVVEGFHSVTDSLPR